MLDLLHRRPAVTAVSSLILLAGLISLGIGAATTGASESQALGPVSPAILSVLNADGTQFQTAPSDTEPAISQGVAVGDAVTDAPWPGGATDISLVQANDDGSIPGAPTSLAWLVTIQPNSAVYRAGGPAPSPNGDSAASAPAANFFVVLIDASDGAFVRASDGYSPALAMASAAKGHSITRAGVVVCGRRILTRRLAASPVLQLSLARPVPTISVAVGSSPRILMVSHSCSDGVSVSLVPKRIFAVERDIRSSRGPGIAAIILSATKAGHATVTARRGGKVLGRLRLVAAHKAR
jgi:hypothetical protein